MKIFYCAMFWICFAVFVYVVYLGMGNNYYIIKDFGFPLGVILFSFGTLWNAKENQEQRKKDTYWSKRLECYYKFKETSGNIAFNFSDEYIREIQLKPFEKTKLGQLYIDLAKLTDECELLFDKNTLCSLNKIRAHMEQIRKYLIELHCMPKDEDFPSFEQKRKNESRRFEIGGLMGDIRLKLLDEEFKNCREKMFAYLRTENKPGILLTSLEKIKNWIEK